MNHQTETVPVLQLKPHPRNYKHHPDEQLAHIIKSIEDNGFYRNVVVARDYTILAGHGVVQAVLKMGIFGPSDVPVIKLDLDPEDPRALKILTGDNELGKLAETDDRRLTELLRDVMTADDLLGTGFDAQSLSALVFVSRPIEEVRSKNEADHWLGMPEYDPGEQRAKLLMFFLSDEDRDKFVEQFDIKVVNKTKNTKNVGSWTAWWPPIDRAQLQGVLFTADEES